MSLVLRPAPARAFARIALIVMFTFLATTAPASALELPTHAVVGSVHADGPVRGAKVDFVDNHGVVIPGTTAYTDVNGVFVVTAPRLSPSVLFRSSGGRDLGGRIIGRMVAYHPVYALGDPVAINPATTLADSYRRAHPGMPQGRAERFVARYLGLPGGVDLGVDLRVNSTEFHGGAFLKAAGRFPQRYAGQLVRHIDANRRREFHAVTIAPKVASVNGVTAQYTPSNAQIILGVSSLSNLAVPGSGMIVGGVLGSILGPDPDPTQIKLDHIIAQLNQLQASVNLIIGEQYHARVSAEYAAYNTAVAPYTLMLDDTQDAWNAYTNIVLLRSSGAPAADVAAATRQFMDFYGGTTGVSGNLDNMLKYMRQIPQSFGGAPAAGGFVPFQAWNTAVLDENRFITSDTQQSIAAAWTFWRTIEVQLLVMNVEYAIQKPELNLPYRDWIARYGRTAAGAEGTEMQSWKTVSKIDNMVPMSTGHVYDQATDRMWLRYPFGPTTYYYASQQSKNFQNAGAPPRMPTIAQLNTVFARAANWPSVHERGATSGRQYLVDQGWKLPMTDANAGLYSSDTDPPNFGFDIVQNAQMIDLKTGDSYNQLLRFADGPNYDVGYTLFTFPARPGIDHPSPN